MRGLVISSGSIEDYLLLKKNVDNSDYIICADGGLNHILNIGKTPDIVVGDLDSVNQKGKVFIKRNNIDVIQYPEVKDKTDTELAILHAISKGIRDIILMGVTGSRIDHTISNIFLLKELYKKGIKVRIIDDNNIIYFSNKYMRIYRKEDVNISIIPLNESGVVITLEGFSYSLNKELIKFGSTLGISNELIEDYGNIVIESGDALIIESKD